MNCTVENMTVCHVCGIAEIEKECFSEPWSEKSIEEELSNSAARFFVALDSGRVVGYIGMHIICGECYIANIAVTGEYRKRGVGTLLLKKAEDTARDENGVFITLEVRQSNENAISLYRNNGYVNAGIRKKFYTSPEEDGIIMTKIFRKGETDNENSRY